MKNLILIIGGVLFLANLLLGMTISVYESFNMWLNCAVISINTILLFAVATMRLKDAFRISLSTLFPLAGIIEFICGFFVAPRFEDNILVILLILELMVQTIILVITNFISTTIK